jgi:hypothetical protein
VLASVSQLRGTDTRGGTTSTATAPFADLAPSLMLPGLMQPGFPVVAPAMALGDEGAVAPGYAAPTPAPATPQPPTAPTGMAAGSGGFSGGFGFTTFAVLAAFMGLAALGFAARLRISPVAYRPVAFISLLERPG